MSETSASLLDRLRLRPDGDDWRRLVDVYTPLIRGWLRQSLRLEADADDVVQDVLAVVVRRLPQFQHNRRLGAFRCWLRTITVNCLRDFRRSRRGKPQGTGDDDLHQALAQLEDHSSDLSRQWDQEHDLHVTRKLLEMIEPEFKGTTWQAFRRVALDGVAAETAAAELGVTPNAVFIAKSRVLARLRQEAEGLID
jgi:RNA polymerase sigma-70 factor (ECF subfamily)